MNHAKVRKQAENAISHSMVTGFAAKLVQQLLDVNDELAEELDTAREQVDDARMEALDDECHCND